MKVALICAMEDEIGLLRKHMDMALTKDHAGVKITNGTLLNHEVVLCLGGIGKVNAGATAQLVASEYKPDLIINIGLAGNCSDLPLGGVVVADRLVYHDFNMDFAAEDPPGLTFFTPDSRLMGYAETVCKGLSLKYKTGAVATGDLFIEDSAVRADIIARTGCSCVEMEGAAIAHIAHKNSIPYVTVKVLSDNADEGAHDTFNAVLPLGAYCETSVGIVTGIMRQL